MIPACIRCIGRIYGIEGGNLTLVCPFTPPKDSGITTWIGPPLNTIYFYNEKKNPKDLKGGRLSVVKNKTSGAYDLTISNLKLQEDQGIYSCDVNTNPLQQKRFNLAFYGNFIKKNLQLTLFICASCGYINCVNILNSTRLNIQILSF